MLDASVRVYDSTMWGSPSISGTAGALIGILDGCLKDGFGSVDVDTLVVASNVATATVSSGHHFTMIDSTGPVIRIEHASPSGLNSDVRITVTSPTQFTFETSGITDQTATTGTTITAKRAPAGFSKLYSATNKAAYQSIDVTSTDLILRVDDTTTTYASVIAYESMSDIDTGSGPSVGTWYLAKSDEATSSVRPWRIYSDGLCFYCFVANASSHPDWYLGMMFFGDPVPVMTIDVYHGMLIADYNGGGSTYLMGLGENTRHGSIARSHTQFGSAIVTSRMSHSIVTGIIGNQSSPVSAPSYQLNHEFLCAPVEVWTHNESVFRAWMPGLYSPLHPGSTLVDSSIQSTVVGGLMDGRNLQVTRNGYNALAIDITGPWR